jgi:hypothetical protein
MYDTIKRWQLWTFQVTGGDRRAVTKSRGEGWLVTYDKETPLGRTRPLNGHRSSHRSQGKRVR